MFWLGETIGALTEIVSHLILVDGKPVPLVVLEEMNGLLRTTLTAPSREHPGA